MIRNLQIPREMRRISCTCLVLLVCLSVGSFADDSKEVRRITFLQSNFEQCLVTSQSIYNFLIYVGSYFERSRISNSEIISVATIYICLFSNNSLERGDLKKFNSNHHCPYLEEKMIPSKSEKFV